jgi:hypothetical protein
MEDAFLKKQDINGLCGLYDQLSPCGLNNNNVKTGTDEFLYHYKAKINSVYDGDGVYEADVFLGLGISAKKELRLYGVDCPEMKFTHRLACKRWVAMRVVDDILQLFICPRCFSIAKIFFGVFQINQDIKSLVHRILALPLGQIKQIAQRLGQKPQKTSKELTLSCVAVHGVLVSPKYSLAYFKSIKISAKDLSPIKTSTSNLPYLPLWSLCVLTTSVR